MLKKITVILILALAIIGLGDLTLKPVSAYSGNVCDYITEVAERRANGCDGNSTVELSGAITTIINAVIGILGIVAAIFIVVGGVNYMTSAGDASKVEKAKKTILWAVIGLIIASLTFVIVNFVLKGILKQS
ncbi:hypothetical protein IKF84_01325 [Candidatus Saccharibacteria bacterium]|nr:hypothetical protein [Candidatus Saccharibacteria bacterium]